MSVPADLESIAGVTIGIAVGFVESLVKVNITVMGVIETFVYSGIGAVSAFLFSALCKYIRKKVFK